MRNKTLNTIMVIVSACIFLSFFLFTKGLGALIQEIKTLTFTWLVLSILLMLLFWVFEMLVIYIITKNFYNTDNLFIKSFKFEIIGQYFGAITPFAAGSHPAQLYAMIENDIPAGTAGSILMVKFMIHQITNIFILVLAFLFKFSYFYSKVSYFIYLFTSGIVVHLIILAFIVLFSISRNLTRNILIFIAKTLRKLRLIKNIENASKKIENELGNFHGNISLIKTNIKLCIAASILTTFQWLAFFSIPYCIYRSFGFNSTDIFTIEAAQIFLINFMAIIPLPGAEVAAESGFYLINSLFFKGSSIITAIFIWRLITYYLCIALGIIFTLLIPSINFKKYKKGVSR